MAVAPASNGAGLLLVLKASSFSTDVGDCCYQWRRGLLPTAAAAATNGDELCYLRAGELCYPRRWLVLPAATSFAIDDGGCCYQRRRALLPTAVAGATSGDELCY
jgi:hypothetical protein